MLCLIQYSVAVADAAAITAARPPAMRMPIVNANTPTRILGREREKERERKRERERERKREREKEREMQKYRKNVV